MEVGGEMVQVELFWELALVETANHRPKNVHDLTSLDVAFSNAERQTACYSTEEPASFHACNLKSLG
jgi:hypothetical protein